jgi:ATP-dependent DNA helicase DinG
LKVRRLTNPLIIPNNPSLLIEGKTIHILTPDGEIEQKSFNEFDIFDENNSYIICYKNLVYKRSNKTFPTYDLLELFAFIHPAKFCTPTIEGLAAFLKLPIPETIEDRLFTQIEICKTLLKQLQNFSNKEKEHIFKICKSMQLGGWSWAEFILLALGEKEENLFKQPNFQNVRSLRVWNELKEWQDFKTGFKEHKYNVSEDEATNRLKQILENKSFETEPRKQQIEYTKGVSQVFREKKHNNSPNTCIAQAGTGTGKTLGYIAPATVWAEKNDAPVWVSTYTKNLQRQIDDELNDLYKDEKEKNTKVVIRKGRENYLCLLNYEEAIAKSQNRPQNLIPLGIISRWISATRQGDVIGGDFSGWLMDLLGRNRVMSLTDMNRECIYSSCPHYKKCFIEKTIRRAKYADIVIANHALTMSQAALGGIDDDNAPTRYIFDEGHHIFSAADSAFSSHLTGNETYELRKWIRGAENTATKTRARGLLKRCEDITGAYPEVHKYILDIIYHAKELPTHNWLKRTKENITMGNIEKFFNQINDFILSKNLKTNNNYSLEAKIENLPDELLSSAKLVRIDFINIITPFERTLKYFEKVLVNDANKIEENTKQKIESLQKSIQNRAVLQLQNWIDMIDSLSHKTSDDFIDWFEIDKIEGRDFDIGMHRHYKDPAQAFGTSFRPLAKSLVITSATLKGKTGDDEKDWELAKRNCGINSLIAGDNNSPDYISVNSPFNYAKSSEIIIVNDLDKNNIAQISNAYKDLFIASDGSALGIFTAISRLKSVKENISEALYNKKINLLSQHTDGIDPSTLIDIFRSDKKSCLLGTDAIRDGIDVPGESLKMIIFDRVPWPRADILHKERRTFFDKKNYDDNITRGKLAQAYGRLIRKNNDKGIFIVLDKSLPSRLLTAFPPDVKITRTGLKEAINIVKEFF